MSLPVRQLVVDEDQLRRLNYNVWSDKFVQGYLQTKGGKEPIKLRYRGGHTRDYPKKSFELVRNGKTVHLNAEFDDPSMIRNALSFRFFEWIGVHSPKTQHVLLRLNGHSLGVYLEIEAVNSAFFRKRGIPVQALMYAVTDSANFGRNDPETNAPKRSLFDGYELRLGGEQDRQQLKGFISSLHALSGSKLELYLNKRLDVNNYLHWLAGAVFTGNYDGFDQNYAIYKHKAKGVYRMVPWDYEGTWGRNCYGNKCGSDLVRVRGYNHLTRKLLGIGKFQARYRAVLEKILDESFTLRKIEPLMEEMAERISPHIYKDTERRWSYSIFRNEPKLIRTYIQERREIISQAIAEKVY